MRIGAIDTPANLIKLGPDLQPITIDWLWVGIRAREGDVAPSRGLRSSAQVTVRAWWDDSLVPGRYLRAEHRLLLIDDVRDITGQQVEMQLACSELIGQPGEYRAEGQPPRSCRICLIHSAPVVDEAGRVTDYQTRAEIALIEAGRPQIGDQLVVGDVTYNVIAYDDGSDDGVVRGLWLEAQ